MDNKLLVCVAFHYVESRVQYLKKVIKELQTYDYSTNIIIDTNTELTKSIDFLNEKNIEIKVHEEMDHPYNLTVKHRQNMLDNINYYDWYMYCEDDMVVPKKNFVSYTEKLKDLWPNYVPGFVRIEIHGEGEQEYTPDIVINITNDMVTKIKDKNYAIIPYHYNYHAFWILSKEELIYSIQKMGESNFLAVPKESEVREYCASLVNWQLNVPCAFSIDENGKLDRSCVSYHVSNNYGHSAKKIEDIWKIQMH